MHQQADTCRYIYGYKTHLGKMTNILKIKNSLRGEENLPVGSQVGTKREVPIAIGREKRGIFENGTKH